MRKCESAEQEIRMRISFVVMMLVGILSPLAVDGGTTALNEGK